MKKNYYLEIDTELKSYENFKPYHKRSIEWISNRIDWCWRFRKIKDEQLTELTERVIKILENNNVY